MSVFESLFNVNCNEHTEKKNGLTYLSWAFAWAEVKKKYPDAFYTIYEDANGCFYHTDGKTAWVKTGVTIEGLEHIEYLPVMDFKNKSIELNNLTSVDVNKTIQRSLTKACARHGLGLYIYAGEDLPEEEKEKANKQNEKISKAYLNTIKNLCVKKGVDEASICSRYNINKLEDMCNAQFDKAMQILNGMPDKE